MQDVHVALQRPVENWGKLLITMRGSLKTEKYFFYLIDFAWTKKDGWQYVAHHEDVTAVVMVPMPDGTMAPITHQAVDGAQKMLGVVTCP